MRPTGNLGYLFQHLAASMSRQSDQVLQEQLGIGYSQFKLLLVLQSDSALQQRHIAEKLGQTEASISRQIKLMHEDGLLQSEVSPRNRREHITTLTRKGTRLTEEAMGILNRYHGPMWQAVGEKKQKQLRDALDLMHQEVCRGDKPGRCHRAIWIERRSINT